MKNRTPVLVLFIATLVVSVVQLLFNLIIREQYRGLLLPFNYFGSINLGFILFFLYSISVFAALGSLIYGFLMYQKNDLFQAFRFAAFAAILKIGISNFFTILLILLWGWYFSYDAILQTIFSIAIYIPLLALLYDTIKKEALLAGNPGQVSIQNLLNFNSANTLGASSSPNISGAATTFPTSPVTPFPQIAALAPSPDAKWKVQVPGQPEQIIDTPTLQFWASSGAIKSNFVIKDAKSDSTYLASQIPGVFSTKSYVTTLLLSFFLGSLGVDRFYLGHVGLGIAKLFTFGGCGIWALIDFILIAVRKVSDSAGRPLA